MRVSKNEQAWEQLFEKYNILNRINETGTCQISSKQINEFRESRLMTKFDNSDQLPPILDNNHITILPDSRGNYILGRFNMFKNLVHKDIKPISKKIPDHIQSIDTNKITSESIALNVAHMSGMIDDVMQTGEGEPSSLLTLTGRMSSGLINYNILSSNKKNYNFSVDKAQIEIDGSYENLNKIFIIEAKNKIPKDFNIRQLYYPFRMYHNLHTTKNIVPVFFTYVDDIFSFHVYKFTDIFNYSSIKEVDQINYILNDSLDIDLDTVKKISKQVTPLAEPIGVPFPQADNFSRILDMLDYLSTPKDKWDLAEAYSFDIRQSDYYANCLVYLGLAIKNKDHTFELNSEGLRIKNMHNSNKRNKQIITKILSHKPFKLAFDSTLKNSGEYDRKYIAHLILKNTTLGGTTPARRVSSVTGWLNWIFSVIDY